MAKRPSTTAQHRRDSQRPESLSWRQRMYDIIFESNTPAGRWFDILLLVAILATILIVALETVPSYKENESLLRTFVAIEWCMTILFTIEYVLRILCSRHPLRYVFSFWGLVDLVSVVPSYLSLFFGSSARSVLMLRSIRLLRVFRVMKLWRMTQGADELSAAIWRSRSKIVVFLATVMVSVTISGSLMYLVETLIIDVDEELGFNPNSQFTSIPQSMYWAIVTMTTVGYGDVVPSTTVGKMLSAVLILIGYSLIIVPTGFVSAELAAIRTQQPAEDRRACEECQATDHPINAEYCYRCGQRLE